MMRKLVISTSSLLLMMLFFAGCMNGNELDNPNEPHRQPMRFQTERPYYFDTVTIFSGYAYNQDEFEYYAEIFFDTFRYYHHLMDIYNPHPLGENNLHYINAHAAERPVEVSADMLTFLLKIQDTYDITQGTNNAALGAVLRIWHDYRTAANLPPLSVSPPVMPSMDVLIAAAQATNIADFIVDSETSTVRFLHPNMSLDVGAIAKGYAAGLAVQAVAEAGMQSILISAGGHVVAHGSPPNRDTWNVGLRDHRPPPSQTADGDSPAETTAALRPAAIDILTFTDATLSVTGGYERFFMTADEHFGHVIDPATLMPARRYLQVAVLHPDSWMAEILATAMFILPQAEGELLAKLHGAEVLWIDAYDYWTATEGYIEISAFFLNR